MLEDPYVYPGTSVLRNRFGVRDAGELARRERDASCAEILALLDSPLPGRYDLAHLQAFHRRIFGGVYEWAGELRSVAIAKVDLFALPMHIAPYLSGVLAQLPGERFLKGMPADRLADRLAHYLAEINAVHPFREGNGRTQRALIGRSPPTPATTSPGSGSLRRATSRPQSRRCAATTHRCARRSAS